MMLMAFVGLVALVAIGASWQGYVLSVLWAWFIVPTFHAPALTIPVAISLTLIAALIRPLPTNDSEEKGLGNMLAKSLIAPLIVLAFGWIVKQFL